jgi:ATP-dependent exoDNAse (exonuclease V) beta subunit
MPTTIINASAGSGKTYRLAVAYLQALLQPLPDGTPTLPQHVLATTFTRAAASEILERVLRRLALAVVSEKERQRLLADIKRPDLGRQDLIDLLQSVCRVLPQLQVGTIDGLFNRIVRVMGLDLAFPAAWAVTDETHAEELALAAADRMLTGPEARESREQWRRYARFKPGIRVRAALVELLEDTRFSLIDVPVAADDPYLAEPQRMTPEDVLKYGRALEAFDGLPPTAKGKPNGHWVNDLKRTRALFTGEPVLMDLLDNSLLRACGQEGGLHRGIAVPVGLRELLGPIARLARADLQRLHEGRLPALAALARRYHLHRREVAYAGAAYTFREIEAAVWTLPPHLSAEDLYFRLDGQIQHLLLDEFQDTSLSQLRFLWPIMTEVRANGRLVFAVGDVKQSIYGWRGADRRLLDRLPDWFESQRPDPHLVREHLADNWRSSPAVLTAIDRIFLNLDQAVCLDPETYSEKSKQQRALARRNAAASFIAGYRNHTPAGENRHLAGRVRLLMIDPAGADQEPDDEEVPGEMETILQAVAYHRSEDPDREIAILCRRRKLMPTILAGLRKQGVVASGEGGNPVADSAAVETVLSMLTWLDHPGHSLAREHVKRSALAAIFGFDGSSRDQLLPRRIQGAVMKRGLAAVVSDWVEHEQFRNRSTVHDQVRAEQLVELARQWDGAGGGRLSGFVEQVRTQRVDNPASSRVRVMTIHGAKGLEFEAVILADIEAAGGGGDGPRLAVTLTTPDAPPTVTLLPDANDAELLGLQDQLQRYQQEKFEEDLSVLYVALTRAKSFLDVVLTADDKPKASLSAIIREKWQQQDPGQHLIEECSAQVQAQSPALVAVMGRDAGIWAAGDSLAIPHLQPVPGRMEAITPSGQEGAGIIKVSLLLHTGNARALERGTAVHALLSRMEWIEDLPSLEEWAASIPSHEANTEACRIAAKDLYPRLRNVNDHLARVFAPATWLEKWKTLGVTRLEVWRERRFAAIVGNDLMNGSFDRVVLGFNAAGKRVRADILDFKTDRVTDDGERNERSQHYLPQLEAYARALGTLTGLAPDAIQTQLVWIN